MTDEETPVPVEPEDEVAALDDAEARRIEAEAQAEQRRARREAKRDAEFRAKLEAEARQEAPARLTEKEQIEQIDAALDLLERADGELLRRVREIRAVANAPLYTSLRPPPGPGLGGLTEAQMEEVGRREASARQGWENERRARQRWVDDQEDVINRLCAGQSTENQVQIRRTFAAMKGRG